MAPAETYLRQALEQARKGRGTCAPNPAVGAVVVHKNFVISSGYHHGAGLPHAEVEALAPVGGEAAESALYVTLEPCCHWGRTPPCTQLIIDGGIREVVYAFRDPNPEVSGKGAMALKAAGIDCRHLPLPEIDRFYQSYQYWTETKLPWITAKLAMTLDGKIAATDGVPVAITGEAVARVTHEGRKQADALLTTARTIACDDPRLDARVGTEAEGKPLYVLDRTAATSVDARIFSTAKSVTIFYGDDGSPDRVSALRAAGAQMRQVGTSATGDGLDLKQVLASIGDDGRHDLWVEAGGTLFEGLLKMRAINRALLYVAPKWLGASAVPAFSDAASELLSQARSTKWEGHGPDALCEVLW